MPRHSKSVSLDTIPFVHETQEEKAPHRAYIVGKFVLLLCAALLTLFTLGYLGTMLWNLLPAIHEYMTAPDPDTIHCLNVLGGKLNRTIPANTTRFEECLWLSLCRRSRWRGSEFRMDVELKAWYDGTADRLIELM